MHKLARSKFSIFLNIILILFLIGYFLVPFVNIGFLVKIYAPFCKLIERFQGDVYLPPWCEDFLIAKPLIKNENVNQNVNLNQNINSAINTNTNQNVGLANPASIKCAADGGIFESYQTAGGEAALCIFKDKSICEEWAYFRGECQIGKCFKNCQAIGTKSEGWYNSCTDELIAYANCGTNPTEEANKSIILTSPTADEQLSSPFKVEGQAIVYQDKIYIRIKNQSGEILISEETAAKHKAGTEWADFSIEIKYEFSTSKEGFVEVYSLDQAGKEVNLVSVPVKF